MKDQLASWRHSAHTATIERRSKVIDGRIHDARRAENGELDAFKSKDKEGHRSFCLRPLRAFTAVSLLCRNFTRAACTWDRRQQGLCHRSTHERT